MITKTTTAQHHQCTASVASFTRRARNVQMLSVIDRISEKKTGFLPLCSSGGSARRSLLRRAKRDIAVGRGRKKGPRSVRKIAVPRGRRRTNEIVVVAGIDRSIDPSADGRFRFERTRGSIDPVSVTRRRRRRRATDDDDRPTRPRDPRPQADRRRTFEKDAGKKKKRSSPHFGSDDDGSDDETMRSGIFLNQVLLRYFVMLCYDRSMMIDDR